MSECSETDSYITVHAKKLEHKLKCHIKEQTVQ